MAQTNSTLLRIRGSVFVLFVRVRSLMTELNRWFSY